MSILYGLSIFNFFGLFTTGARDLSLTDGADGRSPSNLNTAAARVQTPMNSENLIVHCRDQVHRFSLGLQDKTIPDDEIQERTAQLGYNLGQYVQLKRVDGLIYWRTLAAALKSGDFGALLALVE
jgi:hypothetical protein